MGGTIYDDDFYTWSKRQASALRSVAARDRGDAVDWANVIEEVESLGRSQVDAVTSQLALLMQHVALLALAPDDHRDRRHWTGEARAFQRNASKRYRPSMRQAVTADLDGDWRAARQVAADKLGATRELVERRPFRLSELLDGLPIEGLVARARASTREDAP